MKLAAFSQWIINETFRGSEPDGGQIQEQAVECGLLVKTTYDPERHGESEFDTQPGDTYFEYSPELKAAIAAETK